jgi:uncharacterized RDD family membrane protein YckC
MSDLPPPPPPPPPPTTPGPGPQPAAELVPVGPWPRLGARIIDGLVLLIPNFILGAVLTDGSGAFAGGGFAGGDDIAFLIVSTLLGYGYAVWLEASRGQTVGKMAIGIKVIGPDGRIPANDVALRRNAWLLLNLVPVLGGILSFVAAVAIGVTISNDPFKRGTHDNFAGGSAVVRAR